mgnify:FL=1
MKISYTSKNYNISDKFKDILEKKLAKLERYFDEDVSVKVNCIEQAKQDKLEVTINARGMFFRSEVLSDNMYNNIDLALPKIEKQIIKQGSKFKSKLKRDAFANAEAMMEELVKEEPTLPKLVKVKKFDLDPLTVEDAAAYMEALDHNFYVFLNAETGKVCVVYKRNDKDYGLIEVNY